jgi:hypothetical protein
MIELTQSTQFNISDLTIITKRGAISVKGIYEEINLFDSLLNPCMSGSIIIRDAVGLSNDFLFDGTEILNLKIGKDGDKLATQKSFRLYKQTNRKPINQNSEMYTLHFVSEEFLLSMQQKVSRYYETTYSEAAVRIIIDYLKVPVNSLSGEFHKSKGVKNIVIPNLNPFSALNWMSQRAIGEDNVPGFVFFENILGYNFANISNLLAAEEITKINFNVKNLDLTKNNTITEFLGARSFEVIQQYDTIKNISSGVHSGKFIGFDPKTRTIIERPFTFNDHFSLYKSSNPSPTLGAINNRLGSSLTQFNSKQVFHTFNYFSRDSKFIKENDPESVSKEFDTENYVFQREAIFTNLMNQRVKLVVPGNFAISSGFNVYLNIPKYGFKSREEDNRDKTVYGKYLIVGARHIIGYEKHETIFEAVTDSSNRSDKNELYQSSPQQKI